MSDPLSVCPIIGVDIGSRTIAAAYADARQVVKPFANQRQAIDAWLDRLPSRAVIGMEATGRYHELLAERASGRGHRVYVINPKRLANYAKGVGQRGKTDPQDAAVIARYVARESGTLHPYVVPTAMQRTVRDLLSQRANVVRHGGAIRQCLSAMGSGNAALQRAQQQALQGLRALLLEIDAQLKALIKADTGLESKRAQLQSIAGIGLLNSLALTHRFHRTPFANSDAVVAAYGMDPRPKDSGNKVGKRALTKEGNAEDRRLIYLAAQSAIRTKTFKPLYETLRSRGFASTEATVIIARKLLRIAFAVWTSNQPFDPLKVGTACCAKP